MRGYNKIYVLYLKKKWGCVWWFHAWLKIKRIFVGKLTIYSIGIGIFLPNWLIKKLNKIVKYMKWKWECAACSKSDLTSNIFINNNDKRKKREKGETYAFKCISPNIQRMLIHSSNPRAENWTRFLILIVAWCNHC